jgi:hypothetical protein
MELLVKVERDDLLNCVKNESDKNRGCSDMEGGKSVFIIESWYGSYNNYWQKPRVSTRL